jgi:hypothetical protein
MKRKYNCKVCWIDCEHGLKVINCSQCKGKCTSNLSLENVGRYKKRKRTIDIDELVVELMKKSKIHDCVIHDDFIEFPNFDSWL